MKRSLKFLICVCLGIAGFGLGNVLRPSSHQGPERAESGDARRQSGTINFGESGDHNSEDRLRADFQPASLIGNGAPDVIDGSGNLLLPRDYWDRPIFNAISDDFKVTEETKNAFKLSDENVSGIERALAELNHEILSRDIEHSESIATENGAIIKIEEWNPDPEKTLSDLTRELSNHFATFEEAQFFMAQSKEAFSTITGNFGGEPRLVKIKINPNAPGYYAIFRSGSAIGDIDLKEMKEDSKIDPKGTTSKMVLFEEIPPYLKHLVEEP